MPELDFDQAFSNFMRSGESSAITDIYAILPTLSDEQIKVITALEYYISKYDLHDLGAYLKNYILRKADNKNLSIINSMNVKSLLKAYSMEEHWKGISASSVSKKDS